jgi:hypothetical protein
MVRLRELPFVSGSGEGLIVNHVLREAVAAELAAIDRPRHRRLRAGAWRRLRDELTAAGDADLWRYTADMLALLESPIEEVWGGRWDREGNALDSVVSALRRKLGARAGALETVRGVGYRLRPLA